MSDITQLDRRRIEAEMLAQVYATLAERLGPEQALAVVEDTLVRTARAAGRAFAAQAPGGPSLEHFRTVMDVWRRGGVLGIENERSTADTWRFDVTRCGYAEMYRKMGLPESLVPILSCRRDGPFAEGYSDRLVLDRPETIAGGGATCPFRFTWTDR